MLGCVVWVRESCSGPGLCRDGAAGRFERESYVLQSKGEGRLGRPGLEECCAVEALVVREGWGRLLEH